MSTHEYSRPGVFLLRDEVMDNDRYGNNDREIIELDGERVNKIEIYRDR